MPRPRPTIKFEHPEAVLNSDILDLILSTPYLEELPPRVIIANVLLGNYELATLRRGVRLEGICIFALRGAVCDLILVTCPNALKTYLGLFESSLASRGAKMFRFLTQHNPEAFERLAGYKTHYHCLTKEIS